ncbi:MAG: ABC transporter ATP-binding protein [Candidatus Cloacimonetes bacterium]|nr:ABC transporter ATP-binding protein [Candidatus Cloacimonadota bacterium]MBS3768280.1 ABC transporter ATP-binding protein [Candidatus Cloacimonadota bacterium]
MLKRFIRYYLPHKWLFILDMFVAFSASILSIFYPILTRQLLKTHIPNKDMQMILQIIAVMLAILIVKTVCTYIRMRWGHILGVRMEYDMREEIFTHIQKLSFNYFDNVKTGSIMARISNDLNRIAEVAHHAPEDLIISIFIIAGAFIAMFSFNTQLALISIVPLPLLLIWGLTVGRKMRKGFRQVRRKIADINTSVENSVQGIREVKSYTNEDLEIEKFEDVNTSFKSAKEKMYKLMAKFFSGMFFLSDFYYVFVIGGGTILIYHGRLDVVDLLAFTLYINYILQPIRRLVNFVEQLQRGAASFERFIEILDISPEIKDKPYAKDLKNVKGNINIENLDFKYKNTDEWVLKDIDLQIPAGQTVAIVGESGAGKSTLAALIPRFYEPTHGKIEIDGNDIMHVSQKSLRLNIGIVQQSVFLFDTTIRDNITYGDPKCSQAELMEAAKNANIYEFIQSLSNDFDTLTGERGAKLSGGQQQRISIARAFLKNPPILIFDEATSSLDTESEAKIQEAMAKLSQNRTTIIIAHRLSTVKNADVIYVLKNGRIMEKGNHEELLQRKNYYYELYTKNLF